MSFFCFELFFSKNRMDVKTIPNPSHSTADKVWFNNITASKAAKRGSAQANKDARVLPIILAPSKNKTQLIIKNIPFPSIAVYPMTDLGRLIPGSPGINKSVVIVIIPKKHRYRLKVVDPNLFTCFEERIIKNMKLIQRHLIF